MFIAPMINHLLPDSVLSFAAAQTAANEALLACALERFRLARGEYPDSLGDLSPRYLDKLPHDVITGQPLKYRRTQNGQFLLYSVGWNEADDGGTPGIWTDWRGVSHWDQHKGDWVWAFPSENQGTDGAIR